MVEDGNFAELARFMYSSLGDGKQPVPAECFALGKFRHLFQPPSGGFFLPAEWPGAAYPGGRGQCGKQAGRGRDWHASCKDTEVLHKDMCVIVTPTFRYLGPSRRDGPFFWLFLW